MPTYRELALRYALKEVGTEEHPPGSNSGDRVRVYQAADGLKNGTKDTGYPWCASFVNWAFFKADRPLRELGRTASVPLMVTKARAAKWIVSNPAPGDIACYQFPGGMHTGIVKSVSGSSFTAVEGNTSLTSDDNGGKVMIRSRSRSDVAAFIRVPGSPRVKLQVKSRKGKVLFQTDWFAPGFVSEKRHLFSLMKNHRSAFLKAVRGGLSPRVVRLTK